MEKRTLDSDGPVFVADFGGSGPPIVLVHGLGGSHTNWMAVGDALAARGHVYAIDLLGFGRTPLAGRAPKIASNVAMVARFVDHVRGRDRALLVGNSMGGLVSMMVAAERPEGISGLVLVGPALPRPAHAPIDPSVAALFAVYAVPGVGELFMQRRLAKVGPERVLRDTLRVCGVDPARVLPEAWDAALALAHERTGFAWAIPAFLGSARSMLWTLARRGTVEEALRRVRARTLLTMGARDRLVPVAVGEDAVRVRPDWRLVVMDDLGHVPQLQAPERWTATVEAWLDEAAAAT